MEKRSYIKLTLCFRVQVDAALDLKCETEKEPSCWLKSVVVGAEHTFIELINSS